MRPIALRFLTCPKFGNEENVTAIADMLRHQLDVVEGVGLKARRCCNSFIRFIVASGWACPGRRGCRPCYGLAVPERDRHASRELTTWDTAKGEWSNPDIVDLAADAGRGVVMVAAGEMLRYAQDPVMLHEALPRLPRQIDANGFEQGHQAVLQSAQSKAGVRQVPYVLKKSQGILLP